MGRSLGTKTGSGGSPRARCTAAARAGRPDCSGISSSPAQLRSLHPVNTRARQYPTAPCPSSIGSDCNGTGIVRPPLMVGSLHASRAGSDATRWDACDRWDSSHRARITVRADSLLRSLYLLGSGSHRSSEVEDAEALRSNAYCAGRRRSSPFLRGSNPGGAEGEIRRRSRAPIPIPSPSVWL